PTDREWGAVEEKCDSAATLLPDLWFGPFWLRSMVALRQPRSDLKGDPSAGWHIDRNVLWNVVGGGASIGAGVLLLPLTIAVGGATDYGLWLVCYLPAPLGVR